ncbi:MAG: phosphoketolase [Gammaproteobacteria bacterium]|mgnify:CR=1 FL=1|nr:phosphoketolase [Gammaproteobacteria bacterium]|tara:strand:- start:13680 stop:16061 length:2382 start_codon:yes stop_codon:yes gene_type:complete
MIQLNAQNYSQDELDALDIWWRAANYLSVGQIYLLDNPLLKEPLLLDHVKPRLLGHWGTTPGLNFIYVHLNRVIKKYHLNMIYLAGPGHGGPAMLANAWLEGTYSEYYPSISQDEEGMRKLFRQFSFPGGVPSHVAPETPGSIHEGGELGYSLSHAFGAVFDNPDLIAACIIGDGEAETGPLAAAWHSNKFLNPISDGVVLPILHLNGYKIANPTILSRIGRQELESLLYGYGYQPFFVEGEDPALMHENMASSMDKVIKVIHDIKAQAKAKAGSGIDRPCWPMIVLRSPKGWTGPKEIDGKKMEGSWRSHQVPLTDFTNHEERLDALSKWLMSYQPEELFESNGTPVAALKKLAPVGHQRMSDNPHANGGQLLEELQLPDKKLFAVSVEKPGAVMHEATRALGRYLAEVMILNHESQNFRVFGPDETASNRLTALFDVTERTWLGEISTEDEHLAADGRVMEILSEHTCQGWLEGYLLTGRHGFFSCYEAFIHLVGSMFNQHAKWLKVTSKEIPWRKPIASLNYLLTSHVWRQDHNGFSHQDPGFIDHVVNKKADIIRVYLPPDANTLLCVAEQCLASKNKVNVIVAGKQLQWQYLDMDSAMAHCKKGIGIWQWAGNEKKKKPDVILACAGDVPTQEVLAASSILQLYEPDLSIRVVNIVDLMTLQPQSEHPHGLPDSVFDNIFPGRTPVIFAFHGYPWLIHRLTYKRFCHSHMHVRGYKEEGTTTTPFDMLVRNDMDRFHLVIDVVERVKSLEQSADYVKEMMIQKLSEHREYIKANGKDLAAIISWQGPV